MSCGSIWRHCPRIVLTADFHGRAFERSRRDSAQVAAPENCDLWEGKGREGRGGEEREGGWVGGEGRGGEGRDVDNKGRTEEREEEEEMNNGGDGRRGRTEEAELVLLQEKSSAFGEEKLNCLGAVCSAFKLFCGGSIALCHNDHLISHLRVEMGQVLGSHSEGLEAI